MERPLSRASSVSSNEASSVSSDDGERLGVEDLAGYVVPYEGAEMAVMEWLNVVANMPQQQPPPAAALEAKNDGEMQELDSSTDWVVPPPVDEFGNPADSTSWSH